MKILASLLFPSTLGFALLALGLIALPSRRWRGAFAFLKPMLNGEAFFLVTSFPNWPRTSTWQGHGCPCAVRTMFPRHDVVVTS